MKASILSVALFLVALLLIFPSCQFDGLVIPSGPGDWVKAPIFAGTPRSGSVSFTIGNKAFVGLGYDGNFYQNDFYAYDFVTQNWDTIAPFPGQGREHAVAFSLNGKGYVGTGFNRDSILYLQDFWEYNPATFKWKQLKDFGGQPRSSAVAFDDGRNGYIGTGFNHSYFNDFWQYTPLTDSWKQISSYAGQPRMGATTFTILGKTYLFGGVNNGSLISDMQEFDPLANPNSNWKDITPSINNNQFQNFKAAVTRYDGVAFTLNNKGYISCGSYGGLLNTTWQFDPTNQSYLRMANFSAASRSDAVAFVLGTNTLGFKAFVTTGVQGSFRFDDMASFVPAQ